MVVEQANSFFPQGENRIVNGSLFPSIPITPAFFPSSSSSVAFTWQDVFDVSAQNCCSRKMEAEATSLLLKKKGKTLPSSLFRLRLWMGEQGGGGRPTNENERN